MDILEALKQLDPKNDEHWTGDGLPRMDAVEALVGDESIKRADVTAASPDFNREAAAATATFDGTDELTIDDMPEGAYSPDSELTLQEQLADWEAAQARDEESNKPSPMDILQAQRAELEQRLVGVSKKEAKLREKRRVIENQISAIGKRIDQITPSNYDQSEIMRYIRNQNSINQDKAAKRRLLQESGVAEIIRGTGKAPIDQAMAKRKPARGSERPPPRATKN